MKYHLAVKDETGKETLLTSYAMSHKKCMTMKSKFSNPSGIYLKPTYEKKS